MLLLYINQINDNDDTDNDNHISSHLSSSLHFSISGLVPRQPFIFSFCTVQSMSSAVSLCLMKNQSPYSIKEVNDGSMLREIYIKMIILNKQFRYFSTVHLRTQKKNQGVFRRNNK
jgi:ATP-dependent helicase YprA (DUF1998 family)